jgi:hypothetical protein
VSRRAEWTPVVPAVDPAALLGVTMAKKSIPVTVRLTFANGREMTLPSFAHGWTKEHVLVSVEVPKNYYTTRELVWLPAADVRRRTINTGRDYPYTQ